MNNMPPNNFNRSGPNAKAMIIVGGFMALFIAACIIVAVNLFRSSTPATSIDVSKLPPAQQSPEIPDNPVELAFGTDRPDWNLADFNVEETVNAPAFYEDVSKEDARKINDKLPFAKEPIEAANPFFLQTKTPLDLARAQHCLSLAVYYEAGNESFSGQLAVAQVVLNRVRHPAWPHSVCGVVFQGSERKTGCQFTFTCDGSLRRPPSGRLWKMSQNVASAAINGSVSKQVGWATHYHTDWVAPYWAPKLRKLTQIGTHIFYTWPGKGGSRIAFRTAYAEVEAWPTKAAATATNLGTAMLDPLLTSDAGSPLTTLPVPTQNGIPGTLGTRPPSANETGGSKGLYPGSSQGTPGAGRASYGRIASEEDEIGRTWPSETAPIRPSTPVRGPDGLMPEPDLADIMPKYVVPKELPLPKRPVVNAPANPNPKRQDTRGRALEGL